MRKEFFVLILFIGLFISGCTSNNPFIKYHTDFPYVDSDECLSLGGEIREVDIDISLSDLPPDEIPELCLEGEEFKGLITDVDVESACCLAETIETNLRYCEVDEDCILSTVEDDPNLQNLKFMGKKGIGIDAENVDVACVSKDYFEENKENYKLDSNVWTGSESYCGCDNNMCKEIMYGMVPNF